MYGSRSTRGSFIALKSGVKLGLSVAGKIKPGGLVKELAETIGKYILTYYIVSRLEGRSIHLTLATSCQVRQTTIPSAERAAPSHTAAGS
jgi:hypothetical protein